MEIPYGDRLGTSVRGCRRRSVKGESHGAIRLPPTLRKKPRRIGPPCVVVSAESWATLYNRVGVVKRHLDPRRVLTFPFVEGFGVALGVAVALLMRPRPAFRILRWTFGSTNHLSGHSTSDHDSLFRLPILSVRGLWNLRRGQPR
jgi:hypothetical protein